jgi:hypothetical protein
LNLATGFIVWLRVMILSCIQVVKHKKIYLVLSVATSRPSWTYELILHMLWCNLDLYDWTVYVFSKFPSLHSLSFK